ncbi:unnamed protein product [Linum trigynum]|uniref:Uncharacterized protein n=1 Tax=Linum trigynum TaxID=586398 RepID=A0AAV2D8U3_9ROSI
MEFCHEKKKDKTTSVWDQTGTDSESGQGRNEALNRGRASHTGILEFHTAVWFVAVWKSPSLHTGSWESHTAVWPGRVIWNLCLKLDFQPKKRGELGFWFPNTQGTNPRERERLGNILGAILEDFFTIGARESSLEMKIEDLDQISAVSLFSME